MQLPASMTTAAAEELIAAIGDRERINELLVPTRGKHSAAGAEAAFVQALATWANVGEDPTLKTYARGHDDVQIERLLRRLYGVCAAALSERVLSLDGREFTATFRAAVLERLEALGKERPYEASRGPQLEIVCADHLAMSHPASLYSIDANGVASLKDLAAFRQLVNGVIIKAIVGSAFGRNLDPSFPHALTVAIYELFRNTDEHGRTDDLGDLRKRSVRGFHARRFELRPERLSTITSDSPPLAEYCRSLAPARAGAAHVQLVEISVFDTGPGLAPSLTGRPLAHLPPHDELEVVRRCFLKGVSRKNASSAGLGLPNLMEALSRQGGFLRVRTGRTSLYANLARNPVDDYGSAPEFQHWTGNDAPMPRVAGTLFTLLFPLAA